MSEFPIERRGVSRIIAQRGDKLVERMLGIVVYHYQTEEHADSHLDAEARVLGITRQSTRR